jgi:hypothetical protein
MALVEIITQEGCTEYTDVSAAEVALRSLTANIRLDYHGVWDTLPMSFACSGACILSFVGRQSDTRRETRIAIQQAVAAGRVAFGVLVFKRGTTKPATKAWANALMGSPALFVDDSDDHLDTTRALMGDDCISVWKNTNPGEPAELMRKIEDYMRCSVARR